MTALRPDTEVIFHAARDIPDLDRRLEYIREACGGDETLIAHVGALLAAADAFDSLLDRPAGHDPVATIEQHTAKRLGTVIGPYKLLQQIGEGGMGVVWMAEQTQPVQRKVALKVIKPGMDSRQVVARFEAERQALAMMDHVNIARVLDGGTTEAGRPYFVMELVHGIPITQYCDDNHLTPRERLELFVPVCQAIQHAHQKGIIHRDIKPSNVMVTLYDGKPVPKVIDFGVAKATEQNLTERTLFTQYGTMVGTLEYMSPEQAEMSALGVDTRSDIYSLGVLLYELLTGSTPLTHKRLKEAAYGEILRLIKEEEPPKPSTRLSDSGEALASISAQRKTEPAKLSKLMRGELDWIVMKTLDKDRNHRYETANGLAADVLRYLNDEQVQACPPTVMYRLQKFARRNNRVLATACVLALALIMGTLASTWQAIRATRAEGLAEERLSAKTEAQEATQKQLQFTQEAERQASIAKNETTRQLYGARLAQAKAGSLSRRVGQRFESLIAVEEAAKIARDLKLPQESFLDLRNAAIACLALPDLRIVKRWPDWPTGGIADFDDKMEILARSDGQEISIRSVVDDKEIARLPDGWFILSRNGKILATWSHAHMKVWKLGASPPVVALELNGNGFYPDISPDGKLFANAHRDGPVRLYDLTTGKPLRDFPGAPTTGSVAFHPTLRQVSAGRGSLLEIMDLDTGKRIAAFQHAPSIVASHAWSPDGKMIAVFCDDLRFHLWDAATAKKTRILDKLTNAGASFSFNQAGDMLACTSWEGKLRLWNPQSGDQLLIGGLKAIGHLRFSPDGRHLPFSTPEGHLSLREIAAGSEYRTIAIGSSEKAIPYFQPSIHRDGRLMAIGVGGGVGFWDIATGRELHFLALPGINFALFEPDGSLLTNGPSGLRRWPVRIDSMSPECIRLGPPQKLSVPGSIFDLAVSKDGKIIGSAQSNGAFVLHTDRPKYPIRLTPHPDARYVAASPDGKWMATGSHAGSTRIWDAENGKLIKDLAGAGWRVNVSPNGKWLGTVLGGFRLWVVGSWREGPKIGGDGEGADFSPDSKLLAVETGRGVVRLVNPETGQEYARLEDPNQDRAGRITFSPDGTQLVVASGDHHSIHVWDLRAIRTQLATMGLDWDLPPYPPAPLDRAKLVPIKLEVSNHGSPFNDRLWQELLSGNETAHRFIETKHEAKLSLTNAKHLHRTEMKAGKTYVLDLQSSTFDTVLTVEDQDGIWLAENDDIIPSNLNSRIIFTAPATGSYRLITTPYAPGMTGAFVVRIRELVEQK